MNLQQLRDYIRMQLDMDDEELPNAMLDSYLSEAYNRTISMENRWPFFEATFTMTHEAGDVTTEIPPGIDPSGIFSVRDNLTGLRLTQASNEQVEDNFASLALTASPAYYTIWGNEMRLWPNPSDMRELAIRGYRYPNEWMVGGAGAVPDCDTRLHMLLAHYAIALAYAQQEDEVLEDVYMKRWQASFTAARNAIVNPRHHRPLVLNGGLPYYPGTAMQWSNPPVAP